MPPVTRHRHLLDPRTLREALAMRRDDPSAVPIAGCTDVYVSLNFGTVKQTRFINLWRLQELRGIERRDGRLRIAALTTYTELIQSTLVRRAVPMLVAAAREIGGRQIQHRGTIGECRQRFSGRRHPASAGGGRYGRRAGERQRYARGAVHVVL